jgi:hypothetical protein
MLEKKVIKNIPILSGTPRGLYTLHLKIKRQQLL